MPADIKHVPQMESMMAFYTKFANSFDCPTILAEAATEMFKEVLLEASQSSDVADQLRQKVGVNPNETQGIDVFGLSGDDNLPQQTTIDNEISDAMISGSFDSLGDDISTTDPNSFDETAMGLGSSELDTSDNDLNPDDWAAEEQTSDTDIPETAEDENGAGGDELEPAADEGGMEDDLDSTGDDAEMSTGEL